MPPSPSSAGRIRLARARTRCEIAQRHFARVSFDLIYALPGDTAKSWSADLASALALGTTHLSLYQLTIEPGTRFASMVARNEFEPLDADAAAELYELTDAMTSAAGLPAYEISNHARPGHESRHNLTYWRYGDYAGIGPGAHGRRLGMRTVRHRKPENFLSALARNGHGIAEENELSPVEAGDEALVMGLRLSEGLDAAGAGEPPGRALDRPLAERRSAGGLRSSDAERRPDRGHGQRPAAARSRAWRNRSAYFGDAGAAAGVGAGLAGAAATAAGFAGALSSATNL